MPSRPRVFVSYSHDDEDHKTLVRRFAEFLHRRVGLEVHTDGEEPPHVGRGARFEGAVLRDQVTGDIDEYTARILPVVLPGRAVDEIPRFLNPYSTTHFVVRQFQVADCCSPPN
ncbi:hypothetical protein OG439_28650 [Amycolatopsis sp. NBC_01307]|uniref:SEFIR domain-containing protein n=1 Tax=Amycolatopsis sp. NBC_01307 TaxID=2903561 RepID=UPI002E14FFB7|nr:hypothetical protein OG439_28650 [Amycolatopsis sp. NBC_01307]